MTPEDMKMLYALYLKTFTKVASGTRLEEKDFPCLSTAPLEFESARQDDFVRKLMIMTLAATDARDRKPIRYQQDVIDTLKRYAP